MMETDKMYCYKYPHPAVTTDCVIFGYDGSDLKLLLIERGIEPYKGKWALPGGFMRIDETAEECAKRELCEETGLNNVAVRQFHAFTGVDRDPRERVVTISYCALVRLSEVKGGDDAAEASWFSVERLPQLAFDHQLIVDAAYKYLRERIYFEPIGFDLLPEVFTMPMLQHLYETILGVKFDRRNFAGKMRKTGILESVDDRAENTPTRVPRKYKFNRAKYEECRQRVVRFEF